MFTDCVWDIGSRNGTIASPNFPKKYPSSAECIISLMAPLDNVVELKFVSMSLEPMTDGTAYDYVRVYDGRNTSMFFNIQF